MTAPTPLSPAAQEVDDAAYKAWSSSLDSRLIAVVALRAVADQVVPAALPWDRAKWSPFAAEIRVKLLAIAAELEGAHD